MTVRVYVLYKYDIRHQRVNVDKLSDMDLARIKVILESEIKSALSCE